MELPKPIYRLGMQLALRDIPESGAILDKFFDIYWDARREKNDIIKQAYVGRKDPLGKIELGYQHTKSRVIFPLALQVASIAMANKAIYDETLGTVLTSILAYSEATIGDNFHNLVFAPKVLSTQKAADTDPQKIYSAITDLGQMRNVAKSVGPFKVDRKIGPFKLGGIFRKTIYPEQLLDAAMKNRELCEKRMKDRPEAREVLKAGRNGAYMSQAESLYCSMCLAQKDYESLRVYLSGNKGGYKRGVIKIGDKLAYIGQENAVVAFESTKPEDMDSSRADGIKDGLRKLYHGLTLVKQDTQDESLNVWKDMHANSDNLWTMLSLEYHDTLDKDTVREYLRANPDITKAVLLPPLHEMRHGYDILKRMDFAVEDNKLAVGLVTRQAQNDMRKFEKDIVDVDLDKQWSSEATKLREYVGLKS